MDTNRKRTFIINVLFYAIIISLVYLLCKFAFGALLPFIFAALIGFTLRPLIKLISNKLPKVNRKIISVFIVIVFFVLLSLVIFLLGSCILDRATYLYIRLPGFYKRIIEPSVSLILEFSESFISGIIPHTSGFTIDFSEQILESINNLLTDISVKLLGWGTSFATAIPGSMINVILCIVSTFFISVDFDYIKVKIKSVLPKKTTAMLSEIKKALGNTLFRYFKSYFIILFITFAELSVGLLLLKIPNALLIAFFIALLDILPILGTGTVLNPWAVICVLQGDYLRALAIFAIYIAITFIRNIIEPKIVGGQVGLHPLVTLISMITGYKLIGGIGLLVFPILAALFLDLYKKGVLKFKFQTDDCENISAE